MKKLSQALFLGFILLGSYGFAKEQPLQDQVDEAVVEDIAKQLIVKGKQENQKQSDSEVAKRDIYQKDLDFLKSFMTDASENKELEILEDDIFEESLLP